MGGAEFVEELLATVPQAAGAVEDSCADDGTVLVHLLLPDLNRLTVSAFHADDLDLTARVLALVGRGLVEGDEYLENAVAVSFVEHFGAGEGETEDLLALWPRPLRDELTRQHAEALRRRT